MFQTTNQPEHVDLKFPKFAHFPKPRLSVYIYIQQLFKTWHPKMAWRTRTLQKLRILPPKWVVWTLSAFLIAQAFDFWLNTPKPLTLLT